MVSITDSKVTAGKITNGRRLSREIFGFTGLSTDTKPRSVYGDVLIANGSTFFEINTSTVFMYDEENEEWHAL